MKTIRWVLILACFLLFCCLKASTESNIVWKAGAAAVKITPEHSMWMAGYASLTNASQGVAQ